MDNNVDSNSVAAVDGTSENNCEGAPEYMDRMLEGPEDMDENKGAKDSLGELEGPEDMDGVLEGPEDMDGMCPVVGSCV